MELMVKEEEQDRYAEWKGLGRMNCLIKAFADKSVSNRAIEDCKNQVHPTRHLMIVYPLVPSLDQCTVPDLYPNTAAYKIENFAPLPALAEIWTGVVFPVI